MSDATNTTKKIYSKKILEKRAARVLAVQCIYSIEHDKSYNKSIDEKILDIMSSYHIDMLGFVKADIDEAYYIKLVRHVFSNYSDWEAKISEHLLKEWSFARLPSLLRAILLTGACELFLYQDVDNKIIINEYIEISKLFNHEGEAGFINKILHSICAKR